MNQELTAFTVRQWAQRNPAFSEASLRWLVFKAADNGLDKAGAVRRVGRRVLIIGERFNAWMDTQGAAKA